jgi:hypothetical protein
MSVVGEKTEILFWVCVSTDENWGRGSVGVGVLLFNVLTVELSFLCHQDLG